jgi:hypothetical protein
MLARPLLNTILTNDALTRGLADPEARMLVEWVVDQAEYRAESADQPQLVVQTLLRRSRAISRFVGLWCHARERGAACQLAAAERFSWPLPTHWAVDPCELMHAILRAEDAEAEEADQRRQG